MALSFILPRSERTSGLDGRARNGGTSGVPQQLTLPLICVAQIQERDVFRWTLICKYCSRPPRIPAGGQLIARVRIWAEHRMVLIRRVSQVPACTRATNGSQIPNTFRCLSCLYCILCNCERACIPTNHFKTRSVKQGGTEMVASCKLSTVGFLNTHYYFVQVTHCQCNKTSLHCSWQVC
jgi:hypothetical protein